MHVVNNQIRPDAPSRVDQLLGLAVERRASDLHLEPTARGYEVRLRIDGVLETVDTSDVEAGRALVTRLMVLAQLLTYRLDVPQEGRASVESPPISISGTQPTTLDLRIAVIPTVHGLRCVVRLPAELIQPQSLSFLGLPERVLQGIEQFISTNEGLLLVTGPAGSGKTTTLYAILQEISKRRPGTSIVTLEDPVERPLEGITQIQVQPFGQFTYEKALRSILRQDPQVLMLGEIRDASTASLAVQAALSGHQLLCTLHAPHCAGAIARLLEMGLEPYQITSSLAGVLSMRLVRRLNTESSDPKYRGRAPVAEWVEIDDEMRKLILRQADVDEIRRAYSKREGYESLHRCARGLVEQGITTEEEIARAGLI